MTNLLHRSRAKVYSDNHGTKGHYVILGCPGWKMVDWWQSKSFGNQDSQKVFQIKQKYMSFVTSIATCTCILWCPHQQEGIISKLFSNRTVKIKLNILVRVKSRLCFILKLLLIKIRKPLPPWLQWKVLCWYWEIDLRQKTHSHVEVWLIYPH